MGLLIDSSVIVALERAKEQQGQLIGAHDLMIAATAVHHGLSVVTYNQREFIRVKGLQLTIWGKS